MIQEEKASPEAQQNQEESKEKQPVESDFEINPMSKEEWKGEQDPLEPIRKYSEADNEEEIIVTSQSAEINNIEK